MIRRVANTGKFAVTQRVHKETEDLVGEFDTVAQAIHAAIGELMERAIGIRVLAGFLKEATLDGDDEPLRWLGLELARRAVELENDLTELSVDAQEGHFEVKQ